MPAGADAFTTARLFELVSAVFGNRSFVYLYIGLFVLRPNFVAPAINHQATYLPSLFPFLFITIACGAVSGFHSLACSGTTSKQLEDELNCEDR